MQRREILLFLPLALLFIVHAFAQTWDGGTGNGNWGTKNNWNPNVAPISSSTTAIILSGGSQPATNQNISNNFQVNSITFGSGMTTNFSISGNSFNLTGTNPSIIQNSSFTGSISNNLTLSSTVTLGGTGTGTVTLSGVLSGAGGITETGSNRTILSGNNTYTGITTISSGTLQANSNNALGTTSGGTIVQSGGTLLINSGVSLQDNETITLSGTGASSQGALANTGGSAAVNGNILLGANATINSTTGTFTLGNNSAVDTLALNAFNLTLSGSGDTFINSNLTGSGNLIKSGTGTATLYGDNNTFTGTTAVNEGKLIVDTITNNNTGLLGNVTVGDGVGAANSAILQNGENTTPTASDVIVDTISVTINSDGVWNLNKQTETVGSVAGSGNVQLGTGGALTTGGNNASSTLSGVISGAGTVTKTGTGTMNLSGANTFTGATTISGGTLNTSVTNALGSTASLTINAGSTLLLSGTGVSDRINNAATVNLNGGTLSASGTISETMGALTLSTNSTIDLGTGSGTITFASINQVASSVLTVNNWTAGGTDRLYFTNTSGLTPAFLAQIQFSGYGVGATIIGNELVPLSSAIPESDNIIGGIFLILLIAGFEFRRQQKKKKLKSKATLASQSNA